MEPGQVIYTFLKKVFYGLRIAFLNQHIKQGYIAKILQQVILLVAAFSDNSGNRPFVFGEYLCKLKESIVFPFVRVKGPYYRLVTIAHTQVAPIGTRREKQCNLRWLLSEMFSKQFD